MRLALPSLALVAGASCGGGAGSTMPTTPSNAADASGRITVRLAKPDEFPVTPANADGVPETECKPRGAPVDAYYRPVVVFAREQLVNREKGAIHEARFQDGSKPKLRDGLNILVDPRDGIGVLRTVHVGPPFYAPGDAWAGSNYCLHVLQEGGTTTIVVDEMSQWIR